MTTQTRPTPHQRAALEYLAEKKPRGTYRVAEVEISTTGSEIAPTLAEKSAATGYLEQRKLAIQTFRTLRAAGWIMESRRCTTGEVTRGRKRWHAEHVEYQITEAGRTALQPRRR